MVAGIFCGDFQQTLDVQEKGFYGGDVWDFPVLELGLERGDLRAHFVPEVAPIQGVTSCQTVFQVCKLNTHW